MAEMCSHSGPEVSAVDKGGPEPENPRTDLQIIHNGAASASAYITHAIIRYFAVEFDDKKKSYMTAAKLKKARRAQKACIFECTFSR